MPPSLDSLASTLAALVRAAGERTPEGGVGSGDAPLAFCEERLAKAGASIARVGPPAAFVARRAGDARPPLLLSGHVDVVPSGDGWALPPFGATLSEGRLWGRGASDMLASVACFVRLFEERPDLPLAIALTSDEETGMKGADLLVAAGVLGGARGVIVGEPTDFEVGVAEKGVLWARLVARGRAAHASMPEVGENAAEKLIAAWSRVARMPLPGSEHPLLGRATRSLDVLRAGLAVNAVPDRAEGEVDFRYLPGTSPESLVRALEALAAPDATVEVLSSHPPFESDPSGPLALAARRAVAEVRGVDRPGVGLPYGTEACKLAALAPCIVLGPGERALAHTNRESVALRDLADGYAVLERVAVELSASGRAHA